VGPACPPTASWAWDEDARDYREGSPRGKGSDPCSRRRWWPTGRRRRRRQATGGQKISGAGRGIFRAGNISKSPPISANGMPEVAVITPRVSDSFSHAA
jgi:hypothetical protein